MDEKLAAYLAGFYEGEGSISSTSCAGGAGMQTRLSIYSTDEDVLRRASDLTGLGRVYGPTLREGCKPIWRWNIYRKEEVHTAIVAMWPWLGDRRREQILMATKANRWFGDLDIAQPASRMQLFTFEEVILPR